MGLVLCLICFADVVNIFSTLAAAPTVSLLALSSHRRPTQFFKKRIISGSSMSLVELSIFLTTLFFPRFISFGEDQ